MSLTVVALMGLGCAYVTAQELIAGHWALGVMYLGYTVTNAGIIMQMRGGH